MTDARFVASGVALLMPADSTAELAVLLAEPAAPSAIVVELHGHRLSFVRMRQGPLAHGIVEPYRQRDVRDHVSDALRVSDPDYQPVRLGDAGRIFGSGDTAVLVPVGADGPWEELTIPSSPIGRARRMLLRRTGDSADPAYDVVEELDDPGWVCRVCGTVTPDPEPHTAAHGVPGHLRAGSLPGEPLDETRTFAIG